MRDSYRPADLSETCAAFVHRESDPLVLTPARASLRLMHQLAEAMDLALGRSFRCWIP